MTTTTYIHVKKTDEITINNDVLAINITYGCSLFFGNAGADKIDEIISALQKIKKEIKNNE